MSLDHMAIIITGNPGVGKHTVCKEIVDNSKYSILDINSTAKELDLLEPNMESNDVDVEKLEEKINQKISEDSLIVGHLAPYVVNPEKINKVIVLRRSPYDLLEVYKKRGYTQVKTRENAGSEALGIIAFDAMERFGNKVHQIDVTDKSVKEISNIILSIIDGNEYSEEVDWLEIITKNNDLKKIFTD